MIPRALSAEAARSRASRSALVRAAVRASPGRDHSGDSVIGLTRQIGRRIEATDPEALDDETRSAVSGLVARGLTLLADPERRLRPGVGSMTGEPLTDASAWAAVLRAAGSTERHDGFLDLAAPVIGASLATASHRPCSGALLGAAIVAGCESGLLLAGMAGSGNAARFPPLAAPAAAAACARVLDLRGDRLVSAIGIAASSTVGAAVTVDAVREAGQSASNGVLAALLAGAGFTGPAGALEHPRGLLGAVFRARSPGDLPAPPADRIARMASLMSGVSPPAHVRVLAAGLWDLDSTARLVAGLAPGPGTP